MSYERHGDTGTRLYRIWKTMKCRCNDNNHPTLKWYGERGITICEEWLESYTAFKEWVLSHGYEETLELERKDVNRGYYPDNCEWISHHEETMNRRDTLYITINGTTSKLRDVCREKGITINTVNNWRHMNILESKLSERLKTSVIITGGKKEVISV